jgi:hypothetical protein
VRKCHFDNACILARNVAASIWGQSRQQGRAAKGRSVQLARYLQLFQPKRIRKALWLAACCSRCFVVPAEPLLTRSHCASSHCWPWRALDGFAPWQAVVPTVQRLSAQPRVLRPPLAMQPWGAARVAAGGILAAQLRRVEWEAGAGSVFAGRHWHHWAPSAMRQPGRRWQQRRGALTVRPPQI